MGLPVGIVGLPNSGKSTLFNTLLKKQVANVASYPFTTIEPNTGVVAVPDERLKKLAEIIKPEKVVPAVVKFIDIAGLVKNAHQGEGLGNQFLAKIREVDAIVHIIRGFEDESVAHYYGSIDPKRDKEIVDIELELGGIKKPTLYVLNRSKIGNWKLETGNSISVNAKTGEGVDELIKGAYQLLGLITFYTIKGGKEVTAWALRRGETALRASEIVHTDFAKGFIKAEVVGLDDLMMAGNWQAAKNKGKVRLEGRDYQIQDGDVVEFKFGQ
jgi:small GTP-binding protein